MRSFDRAAAGFAFAAGLLAAAAVCAQTDPGASVAPRASLRLSDHFAPTPLAIPGARVIDTQQLRERIAGGSPLPALLDTAEGIGHDSIPGAVWLPGTGLGTGFDDAVQQHLANALEHFADGDRTRALVFFCVSRNCWLSYNAALRAVRLGYRDVYWYRGGLEAWQAAGGTLEPPKAVWRRPQQRQ